MELLLFVIASFVVYIAYRMKTVVVPSLRRPGAFPYENIRGKTHIQVEILLPKRAENSPLRIEYEVTYAGLVRTLKIDALAIFNSLKSDKKYVLGHDLTIESTEFTSPGNEPGKTSLIMRQEFAIQGYLNCSPQAFDFLIRELNDRKSVALRVFGPVVEKADNRVKMASNSFQLLTEGAISGPEHFREGYWNYIDSADPEETKFLRVFADRFDIHKH